MNLKYKDLNNVEKSQVLNTYISIREDEEEKPCSITRALTDIHECTLIREFGNYIMVLV